MNEIKHYRLQAGMTQSQLAKNSGLTKSAICNYEKGLRTPTLKQVYRIVEALKRAGVSCTVNDLFPPESLSEAS